MEKILKQINQRLKREERHILLFLDKLCSLLSKTDLTGILIFKNWFECFSDFRKLL